MFLGNELLIYENRCYTFVLCPSLIRFAVNYSKDDIVLISVRDLNSLQELDPIATAVSYH